MTFIQYSERFKCTYSRYAIQFSFKLHHANERLFTSNHMFRVQLAINLTSGNQGAS